MVCAGEQNDHGQWGVSIASSENKSACWQCRKVSFELTQRSGHHCLLCTRGVYVPFTRHVRSSLSGAEKKILWTVKMSGHSTVRRNNEERWLTTIKNHAFLNDTSCGDKSEQSRRRHRRCRRASFHFSFMIFLYKSRETAHKDNPRKVEPFATLNSVVTSFLSIVATTLHLRDAK